MKTISNEKQLLKKLGITDLSQLQEGNAAKLASLMTRCDPELVKDILGKLPDFSGTSKELIGCFRDLTTRSFDQSATAQEALYTGCNKVLDSLYRELQADSLSMEERERIENEMLEVLQYLRENAAACRSIPEKLADAVSSIIGPVMCLGVAIGIYLLRSSSGDQSSPIVCENPDEENEADVIETVEDNCA